MILIEQHRDMKYFNIYSIFTSKDSFKASNFGNDTQYFLQILLINLIKIRQFLTINIKHSNNFSFAIPYGHNNFRLRFGATGNMPWKLINILNNNSTIILPTRTTDSLPFRYQCTGGWTLETIQYQFVIAFIYEIVADPPPVELCFQDGDQV